MRIKQISVTKLFGIFNHVIPLNMSNRITIIHGKNGYGKTTLLRMVNSLFNLRFSELHRIPFDDFKVAFDNGSFIEVTKTNKIASNLNQQDFIKISLKKDNGELEKDFELKKIEEQELDFSILPLNSNNAILQNIIFRTWLDLANGQQLDLQEVSELDGDVLAGDNKQNIPEWFQDIRDAVNIRFIESQRLLNLSNNFTFKQSSYKTSLELSVAKYADELAKYIQAKLAEYGTLAQSLDRTFPVRVIQQPSNRLTDEELRNKLYELEDKRSHLINTGLLEKDQNSNFQVQEKIDESTKKLLSVYVEDVEQKLSVFEDLAERIDIFKRIINQRFSYKKLNISKKTGFTFTFNDRFLSTSSLSSGEQHELVILYELLFKVKPNSLILIDEPELSLHVEWQVQFLKDLESITKITEIDILMATHSPDLIHDRWDLTVELKGPNE